MKSFYDLCQQYQVWIIKYIPYFNNQAVYMIWYTDAEDGDDKFLVSRENKIIAARQIAAVYDIVSREPQVSAQIKEWLSVLRQVELKEDSCCNVKPLVKSLLQSELDKQQVASLVAVLNLYEDYIYQLGSNYERNTAVDELWNYYYENIFWPEFNTRGERNLMDQFPLRYDAKKTGEAVLALVRFFEENIVVAE